MRSEVDRHSDQLVERLKLLVFFHLGADASSSFRLTPKGLEASFDHLRVNPFELQIRAEELTAFADNPEKIEQLFLELLVKNRRG